MKKVFTILMAFAMCVVLCVPAYAFPVDGSGHYAFPDCEYCKDADIKIIYRDADDSVRIMTLQAPGQYYTAGAYIRELNGQSYLQAGHYGSGILAKSYSCKHILNSDGTYTTIYQNTEYQGVTSNKLDGDPSVWNGRIIASTHNITASEDYEFFFPVTPMPVNYSMTVAQMSGEGLPEMEETVGGQMSILALCGVGCLALLIALPLFGKVLRRFLN